MKYHDIVRDNILTHNQQVQGVYPRLGEEGTAFHYTIGNTERGLPELLLIGNLNPNLATMALNELGQKMREKGQPLPQGEVDIDWTFPFKIRKAGPRAKIIYTVKVGEYYGHEDYDVLQVMICDPHGRYPGDAGCTMDVDLP